MAIGNLVAEEIRFVIVSSLLMSVLFVSLNVIKGREGSSYAAFQM